MQKAWRELDEQTRFALKCGGAFVTVSLILMLEVTGHELRAAEMERELARLRNVCVVVED